MDTKEFTGRVPLSVLDDLALSYGRLWLILTLLHRPRDRAAPLPEDPHLRADIDLPPLPTRAVVAGAWIMRYL